MSKEARIGTRFALLSLAVSALLMLALSSSGFALRTLDLRDKYPNIPADPRERALNVKLPLEQAEDLWRFMSRADFLAGKLILRITHAGEHDTMEIVIFENGKFSDGWDAISMTGQYAGGEINFGFTSTKKYLTAPSDELELQLTVTKDLPGIGPFSTGILHAGTYTSRGSYSLLVDEFDATKWRDRLRQWWGGLKPEDEKNLDKMKKEVEFRAFCENWQIQWPLDITSDKGWMPADRAAAVKAQAEKRESSVAATETAADNNTRCRTALKSIALALAMYQTDYNELMPPSLQVLVDNRYKPAPGSPLTFRCPSSPRADEPVDPKSVDETGDYYYAPLKPSTTPGTAKEDRGQSVRDVSAVPVIWEKESFHAAGKVNVVFLDYHVTEIDLNRLNELVNENSAFYVSPPKLPSPSGK